ncbi:MAG: YtfJ family protein [Rikenellaceae bacterium]|nr:YtfJ family protein [Rikenellaceae bacterium]
MKKYIIILISALFAVLPALSQNDNVGKKVGPVEIRDKDNNPIMLPRLGEKHLLIFYVDPDKPNQNKDFREHLEKNHIESDNIYGFGIVNLKDAPMLPNGIVRNMAAKKAAENDADIFFDPSHAVKDAWALGDCNNKFIIMFVTKEGVIEFFRWGKYSEQDIADFYEVIDKYK